jgi:hypothetical protein
VQGSTSGSPGTTATGSTSSGSTGGSGGPGGATGSTGTSGSATLTFSAPITVQLDNTIRDVQFGRVNNDSNQDLVVLEDTTSASSKAIQVLLGQGNGTFVDGGYTAIAHLKAFALGDLDHNGFTDLVVSADNSKWVTVMPDLTGNGFSMPGVSFSINSTGNDGGATGPLAVVQVPNSTNPVLLAPRLSKLEVVGNPAPSGFALTNVQSLTASNFYDLETGDFDGDGLVDAVLTTASGFYLFQGQSSGLFAAMPMVSNTVSNFTQTALVDMDHDGRADLVIPDTNVFSGTVALVMKSHGDGTFADPVGIPATYATQTFGVADLDGDGYPEIVAGNIECGTVTADGGLLPDGGLIPPLLSVFHNDTDGGFSDGGVYLLPACPDGPRIRVGDLNGDGRPDLVVGNYASHQLMVLLGQ